MKSVGFSLFKPKRKKKKRKVSFEEKMVLEFGLGFIDRLTGAKTTAYTHLEDLADRLNHFISCVIILMLSGVTMANVYFLRPISCTLPTSPDNKFNEFAESVCWVRGTIAIRENDQMPLTDEDWDQLRDKADMSFYQWVPFCLSIQAMLFFIPHIIWQSLATHLLGENLESILDMAYKANTADDYIKRQKFVESAAYQLFRLSCQHYNNHNHPLTKWSKIQQKYSNYSISSLFIIGKHIGNYISIIYIIIKLLYLMNLIGQLYIIKTLLGYHGNLYHFGNQLILTLKSKHEWIESEFFPRQTYCPIQVRHLGTKNNLFTAICALPVNMFNEKIYIFLWLWILFVTMITIISIINWVIRFIIKNCQTTYIQHYLVVSIQSQLLDKYFNHSFDCDGCNIQLNDIRIHQFIKKFIKNDGYFLIHMLRDNIGDIITGEILNQWWHMFIDYHKAYINREKQLKQNEHNNNNNKGKQYDYMNITLDNDTILNPNSDQSNGNFV
ncbi:Innexin inx2, variant 2 [Schistosoma haematobium]|uniref:Innexin n=1 Tax=Schistosoma haematobium TaxID=6185 RepID=A0A922LT46_SCHHA|nr:Innexin inx2, variant 2 [Schistosoma haematobium]KAH9592903.1 Innexin inx2, variant 2 [Schistosoma haematobium]